MKRSVTLLSSCVLVAAGCNVAVRSATTREHAASTHYPGEPELSSSGEAGADRLYLATLAAAELSLRLHETDRAMHWLAEAPAERRGWEWRYLIGQSDRSSALFDVERGVITDMTVSPNGRLLAVGTGSGGVVLLDASSGALVRTLEGHTAAVWRPTFTSDGHRLATASSDGSVRVWRTDTGRELLLLPGNGLGVAAVAWSPDDREVAVSSWDRTPERGVWGTLNVWDATTGMRIRHIEYGDRPLASLTYTRDGSRLVAGSWDFNLIVWDTRTWAEPAVLPPPESPDYKRVTDFSLSPDGDLAVSYTDGRARIWDLERGVVKRTLYTPVEGHIKFLNDVTYLAGGEWAATGGDDLTVRVWDAVTGTQLAVLHGHQRPINTVAASPDGRRLYSGGAEGSIRMWDLDALDSRRSQWQVPHTVYSIAFGPGEAQAVVATWEGWLRVFDVTTGAEVRAWHGHQRAAVMVDWSADGRWIASTGSDGRVLLWDAATGQPLRELQNVGTQLESLAFNADGSLLAAPASGATVRVWRIPAGEELATLSAGDAAVAAVAWAADGTLAVTSADGKVWFWETATRSVMSIIDVGSSGTPVTAFHPNGKEIAIALGRSVRVWDRAAGRWSSTLSTRSAGILRLAYSMDGKRLAAALTGNVFELWDASTGDVVLRLPQTGGAWGVRWTRHDDLVLIPLDQTVRVLRAPPENRP